jgi:hypothetical protein
MVIIVRIDLSKYDAGQLREFVKDGILTVGEACNAEAILRMSDYERVLWIRSVKGVRKAG